VKYTSVRIFLAVAVKSDLDIVQKDALTAFLGAPMDTEVYITLPEAFNGDPNPSPANTSSKITYHRLLKAVPGIKEGSRLWNNLAHAGFDNEGFVRIQDDYCFYTHPLFGIYLILWVDDLFFAFSVFDILSIRVKRDRRNRRASLDQTAAIDKLLERAGMCDSNLEVTPLATNSIFTKNDCPQTPVDIANYKEQAILLPLFCNCANSSVCVDEIGYLFCCQ
jgi:hypothetical protein